MVTNGFSWPSMVLVSSAVNTSPKAIGTALAPMFLKVSRKMLFCITRTFTPSKSSHFVTGRRSW